MRSQTPPRSNRSPRPGRRRLTTVTSISLETAWATRTPPAAFDPAEPRPAYPDCLGSSAHGLFVRPDRCDTRHDGVHAKPAPLGMVARERRQAPRDAVPPQPL